jgi:hypothetical protein
MRARVYAENIETGERRYIDTVLYDNMSRAIQMYEDELSENGDEEIVLVEITEKISQRLGREEL